MPDAKREMTVVPDDIERITVEEAVGEAKDRLELLQKVTEISLKRTYKQDWVSFPLKDDPRGRPYLTAAGAERIRPLFGITIDNQVVQRHDDPKDGSYMYVISGVAHFRGDSLAVLGTCTSKDQFFSTRYETTAGKRERVTLSAEEVNQENVLKSARSDMVRNAVVGILGLRNLTWDLLAQFGFKPEEAATVRYADRKQEESKSPNPTPPAKPVVAQGLAAPAPAQPNGAAPPDGKSWYTSLMGEIAKDAGGSVYSPKGLELLRTLTAFTPKATAEKPNPVPFPGFQSWEQLERSKNKERAALIAYKRLIETKKEVFHPTSDAPIEDVPQEGLGI